MQYKACVTNHSSQTSFCPEAPANCQSTSSHAPEITITATLLMSNLSQTIFYRTTHTHSAVHAMARCVCPFVCHTSVLYQYICTYHPPRNECHVFTLVLWWQRPWWIFNSRHSPRCNFQLTISRKEYMTLTLTLRRVNRKSYVLYQTVTLLVNLCNLNHPKPPPSVNKLYRLC